MRQGLSRPIYDLMDRGGKRMRPGICFLVAKCFGKGPEEVVDVAALVELVHHATLMVDDIEDSRYRVVVWELRDSLVRRGKPCVHLLFGNDVAINAGNFLYFAPFKKLLETGRYSDS